MKGLKMPMTSEQGVEAAKRAKSTATMANTLVKALAKRYERRWQFVDFLGPKGAESAGVVDLIAIRKDGRAPTVPGLKRLDLFDMILIQVKGAAQKARRLKTKHACARSATITALARSCYLNGARKRRLGGRFSGRTTNGKRLVFRKSSANRDFTVCDCHEHFDSPVRPVGSLNPTDSTEPGRFLAGRNSGPVAAGHAARGVDCSVPIRVNQSQITNDRYRCI